MASRSCLGEVALVPWHVLFRDRLGTFNSDYLLPIRMLRARQLAGCRGSRKGLSGELRSPKSPPTPKVPAKRGRPRKHPVKESASEIAVSPESGSKSQFPRSGEVEPKSPDLQSNAPSGKNGGHKGQAKGTAT